GLQHPEILHEVLQKRVRNATQGVSGAVIAMSGYRGLWDLMGDNEKWWGMVFCLTISNDVS
ncbi:MAG: hypothetical protein K5893_03920, partial [Prevotella sp.]|nr:hypothetical protein [Prevotella sp.]